MIIQTAKSILTSGSGRQTVNENQVDDPNNIAAQYRKTFDKGTGVSGELVLDEYGFLRFVADGDDDQETVVIDTALVHVCKITRRYKRGLSKGTGGIRLKYGRNDVIFAVDKPMLQKWKKKIDQAMDVRVATYYRLIAKYLDHSKQLEANTRRNIEEQKKRTLLKKEELLMSQNATGIMRIEELEKKYINTLEQVISELSEKNKWIQTKLFEAQDVEDQLSELLSEEIQEIPSGISEPNAQPPPPPCAPAVPSAPLFAPKSCNANKPAIPKAPKPSCDLKQFHLEQIPNTKISESIFVKKKLVDRTKDLLQKIEMKPLEDLFQVKKKVTPKKHEKKNSEPSTLLAPDRVFQVTLQLKSFRGFSYSQLCTAIRELDEEVISEHNICQIQGIIPTQSEIELFKSHNDDISELSDADKFYKELSNISFLEERLQYLQFKLQFSGLISHIEKNLNQMDLTCKNLKENEKFQQFLTVVLAVCNTLNGRIPSKQAAGFKLSTLNKLQESRSTSCSMSLLDFIVQFCYTNCPEVLDLDEELAIVKQSAKVVWRDVIESLTNLKSKQESLRLTLTPEMQEDDQLYSAIVDFLDQSDETLSRIQKKYTTVHNLLQEIAALYGEDDQMMITNPAEFFNHLARFLHAFKASKIRESKRASKSLSSA